MRPKRIRRSLEELHINGAGHVADADVESSASLVVASELDLASMLGTKKGIQVSI
jgi:hypothetical protein